MKSNKYLNIKGALLDEQQLEKYLEKIASEHILKNSCDKDTFPIPRLDKNVKYITKTYEMLNSNLKLGINIHPAGEWILDNYYIIEEAYKNIRKELTLNKYINFIGIANGKYKGFSRVYVLASEIVAYTDGKINTKQLENIIQAYQNKKTLNMEEIWSLNVFLDIALIEQIRNVCEKIYYVQLEKYKVENIIERLVEGKSKDEQIFNNRFKNIKIESNSGKEAFVEYLSYRLKKYGRKGMPYAKILEEQVRKTGTTINEIIKKEHFDIAIKKVSIGNCIKSIKDLQRTNFDSIFENVNGVEEIMKEDPANVYSKMTISTKEYYRSKIKEISKKTKISEIYIASKALELANKNKENENFKMAHIGYYLIDVGKEKLLNSLGIKQKKQLNKKAVYVGMIITLTSLFTMILTLFLNKIINNTAISVLFLVFSYIPNSEIVIKVIQYVLSKTIKPKKIPQIDFADKDIPKEKSTIVVIPTILKSSEQVKKMMKKLEIFYQANKSKNLFFTLLGDCSTSDKENEDFDKDIILEGKKQVEELNKKYSDENNIFGFIYRKRTWNPKEGKFLGWERKRGLLHEFNNFLIKKGNNTFAFNSLKEKEIPEIKYVITLDSDTELILDSAKKLIGAMSHILNKPRIKDGIVIDGYGIIQPRIGIDINSSNVSLFTKIFAGPGGTDCYTNAISDIYQDNFNEGIYTGKGIYDLQVFNEVLENAIPEDTILSHDLIEGVYLRCGLASDIILLDSYPTKFVSFINRQARWIRGDWQTIKWLNDNIENNKQENVENPISELSKFKIIDNFRRSLLEVTQILSLILLLIIKLIFRINLNGYIAIVFISIFINLLIEIINKIVFKKGGIKKQDNFDNSITGIKSTILRSIISFCSMPYIALISVKSIVKTIYRVYKTHEHLLEWTTAEEAEKTSKNDIISYIKLMWINVLSGIILIIIFAFSFNILSLILGISWILGPIICFYISKRNKGQENKELITKEEKYYILDIANRTWAFFEKYLTKENNYLPPDNYQEGRKNEIVDRTSSTNIGLALLSVISAYDLKFINIEICLELVKNIINTVITLPKWNGHLYNWYNIKNLTPLIPMYVSTVDSGNFVGYLYTTKNFLSNIKKEEIQKKYNVKELITKITDIIEKTDFSILYNTENGLFSIGFNIEENKLTDSYYDLLASEARQSSLIAIAQKQVPANHWKNLGRSLTVLNGKKGLVSWSGTAFEYLMPNINIKKYKGSLLDESCRFMVMLQRKYCQRLGIPWGISEAAFNLKDLNSNYQYKAFGIPWLGLKRGLSEELVVSSYGSILAISDYPKEVIQNLKELEKLKMYGKFGFYESVDFTPKRLGKNKKFEVVKTYMAHHQALILASINNLINENILQERFFNNPEIQATDILLQERMPEDIITTKDKKEKIEKIKYIGENNYIEREIDATKNSIGNGNIISNENYTIYMNEDGTGFSRLGNILINRYKKTDKEKQGIRIYFKNIKTRTVWDSFEPEKNLKSKNYKIIFAPDMDKQYKIKENIKTTIKTIVSPSDNVEIRNIKIENMGEDTETLEISSVLEPVLSEAGQDYAHKAFNNLFLKYEELDEGLLIKRNVRDNKSNVYMATGLYGNQNKISKLEYEINKENLYGRLNNEIPKMIKNSENYSNEIGLVVNPIVSFKRILKLERGESSELNLLISVSKDKKVAIENLKKYRSMENMDRIFEISKTRTEEESRYLDITGKEIILYQKILSSIIGKNKLKQNYLNKEFNEEYYQKDLWKFGISGDNPIILVNISNIDDNYIIKEILKAYQYFISKGIRIDLVIIDKEKKDQFVKDGILNETINAKLEYLIGRGVFIVEQEKNKKIDAIEIKADLIIDASLGSLEEAIKEQEEKIDKEKETKNELEEEENFEKVEIDKMNLKYFNSYGGFTEDGKEYVINANKNVPLAWSNILANENFGTVVTQNLGGYTWNKNCRLNRITKWSNDSLIDTPSEAIYIQDIENKKYWRIGKQDVLAKYGFGYANYQQNKIDLKTNLTVFVPNDKNAKINILKIKNNTNNKRKINLVYKLDLVLGEDELQTNNLIKLKYLKEENKLKAKSIYHTDMLNDIYITCNENIDSYTGNADTLNVRNIAKLNKQNCLGHGNTVALKINIELNPFEEKKIVFIIADEKENIDPNMDEEYLEKTIKYWSNLLGKIKVKTPIESMNIILNGWMLYQTIVSRLYARSGFYQSGGAYGFRDQLQDSLALKYIDSDMLKKQILKHVKHQFIEGDVLHWWHEETKKGVRTRFSDDRLWLVYLVIEYIRASGDKSILDIKEPYLKGERLKENEDERYNFFDIDESLQEDIYSHCVRAINVSLRFGENGLPLIGSGDWNDGFSTVGNKGKGESVWLGFFLYDILNKFIEIVKDKGDYELYNKYLEVIENLKIKLNSAGWDGRWFKRAFCDDGQVLGTFENEECRIDSIAQSWGTISEAGDNDKKYISMDNLEKYLIDRDTGIIKLLDPPFEKSSLNPGYIKSYMPGVRENGGQYTHAAIWAIIAMTKLNEAEKAVNYYTMINPIEHSNTREKANKYKVEPYVISADVYGSKNLLRKRWMDMVYWVKQLVL